MCLVREKMRRLGLSGRDLHWWLPRCLERPEEATPRSVFPLTQCVGCAADCPESPMRAGPSASPFFCSEPPIRSGSEPVPVSCCPGSAPRRPPLVGKSVDPRVCPPSSAVSSIVDIHRELKVGEWPMPDPPGSCPHAQAACASSCLSHGCNVCVPCHVILVRPWLA